MQELKGKKMALMAADIWTAGMRRAWAPSRYRSVERFARERIVLPDSSPIPGALDLRVTPYLIEPAEQLRNPHVREIVIIAPSQVGKTVFHFVLISWTADQDPSMLQFVMGRDRDAKHIATDRFRPIIMSSPKLRQYVHNESRQILSSKIELNGALFFFESAGSAAALASKPLKRCCADETHLWDLDVEGEGNPLDLLKGGLTNYFDSQMVVTTTPTHEEEIGWQEYLKGDMCVFEVPCPRCGIYQEWTFEQIRAPRGMEDADLVRMSGSCWLECRQCAGRIEEGERMSLASLGRWRAQKARGRTSVKSYRISGLYSPWRTFSEIYALWMECAGDPLKLKSYYNTVLGLPWEDRVDEVQLRRTEVLSGMPYARGEIPADVELVTAFVDWHGKERGLYWSLWGWGSRRRWTWCWRSMMSSSTRRFTSARW